MSKLARTLILAATVAALNLPGMTAVAQTNDQDTTSQQELADNWNYYNQATHIPPAELKARMQAEAAQRKLAERWTHYNHATQMSPAELKTWMQAQGPPGHHDTAAYPGARRPGAADRAERAANLAGRLAGGAGGGTGARRWTGPAGRPARQPPGSGRARDLTTLTVTYLDGAAASTGSPIALPTVHCSPTLPAAIDHELNYPHRAGQH
jgi:hypothetical protein